MATPGVRKPPGGGDVQAACKLKRQCASYGIDFQSRKQEKFMASKQPGEGESQSQSPQIMLSTLAPSGSDGSPTVHYFPKEIDASGNVEHKLRLINITRERLEHLKTQMKWRVEEGRGEAIYRIGVMDDGEAVGIVQGELDESHSTLNRAARSLGFHTCILETFGGLIAGCHCSTVAVRKTVKVTAVSKDNCVKEVRIVIVGPTESGKSSIAGYLSRGVVDDGQGKAGRVVAVHKHEIRHGKTSSFSTHTLPSAAVQSQSVASTMKGVENIFCDMDLEFDVDEQGTSEDEGDHIIRGASKIVTLVDTGGHPKALSSCLRGISASAPDYFLICVDKSSMGSVKHNDDITIAQEFRRLAEQASIPYIIVLTKSDLAGPDDIDSSIFGEHVIMINSAFTVEGLVSNMPQVVPLVGVSTVTGKGMDVLAKLLNLLPVPIREDLPLMHHISGKVSKATDTIVQEDTNQCPGDEFKSNNIGENIVEDQRKTPSVLAIIKHYLIAPDDIVKAPQLATQSILSGVQQSSSPITTDPETTEDMSQLFGGEDHERAESSSPPSLASTSSNSMSGSGAHSLTSVNRPKLIVVGVVRSGQLSVGQIVFVGPDRDTLAYARAKVVTMRNASGSSVGTASKGITVSMHVQFLDGEEDEDYVSRGAVVCDQPSLIEPFMQRMFTVTLKTTEHVLKKNEEVVVYIGAASQACRVLNIDGEVACLQLVFRPEYILRKTVFIRRGRQALVGFVRWDC